MSDQVFCKFKHVPSKKDGEQLASNMQTFVKPKLFNKNGIKNCGENGNDMIEFTLPRYEANSVRDQLAHVLPNDNSPIWFTIGSDPFHSLDEFPLQTTEDTRHQGSKFRATCQFGSLRSYNQFYSHVLFNNQVVDITFEPSRPDSDSFNIEFENYRLAIPFDSIQKKNILINKENERRNGTFILFPLKYVPHIYRLEKTKDNNIKTHRLCRDEKNVNFIERIAECSDLVLYFSSSSNAPWAFLRHFLDDRPYRYELNFCNFKIFDTSRDTNPRSRPDPFDFKHAKFQDRYALQMLISLGFVFRDKWAELNDDELGWNQWNPNDRYRLCCFAVEQLRQDHGYDLRRTKIDFDAKKKDKKKSDEQQAISVLPNQRLEVALCTLTPLKTIFQPLEVTTGSRALRNSRLSGVERFLLVHFREEDNDRLRVNNDNIKQRLRNAMLNGIDLFGKTFKYMGASTGQMKEMAFWFIDLPPDIKTITDAHGLLGKFDSIKNIATYIARVGQYFSSAWPVNIKLIEVQSPKDMQPYGQSNYVLKIDDIEKKSYRFTDGIGKISWGLAGRIALRMNIPLLNKEDIPSAFQIRVAGCKGMVAIDPESTLNDYYIHVRPSMMKFQSDDWNLEICEFARPLTLTLNNQVIRLLSDLGNSDNKFIALQNRGFIQWEVPEEQQPTAIDIAVQKNFSYSSSKDNLLSNRIPIPPTDGRNMFGVADELGELKYGECFIQYSSLNSTNNRQRRFHIVTGTVLVTKNPCLWPGDFRRLTAVRNSKLEECMRDVIVFPTVGERPHPNEIAGSDLDGDQYWVYWGDDFKIEQNADPLSYEGAKKSEERIINNEKIVEHIVQSFGAGIILGMIANTHTVVADKNSKHSFANDARELAELFSLAVDSPKTGKFIDKEQLRPYQRKYCSSWPKYMKKFGQKPCESNSVLEQLYERALSKYQEFSQKPMVNTFPQRRTGGASALQITDKKFEKWIEEGIYDEPSTIAKPPKTKTNKSDHDNTQNNDISIPPSKSKASAIKEKPSVENEPPQTKPSGKRSSGSAAQKSKPSTDNENPVGLINSDNQPSAAASLSSVATSCNAQSDTDFLMAVDSKTTVATAVQFSSIDKSLYIVHLNKDPNDKLDREQIINKLIAYMDKHPIFKTKSSPYKETLHGTLSLVIFYGHIYFFEQKTFPKKLGELQTLITEKNNEQTIRFNYANINDPNIPNKSSSTTKKNKIDYEFDCHLNSSSEYYSLLFDKNKTLRQIRVYYIWSKCYVRLLNFHVDNLYEIRSMITHDSGSLEFERISNLIFQSQSKDLLKDRKPNIKIDRSILRSTIIPISLKIIDEDQQTQIDQSTAEAFYRSVKYVSINEQKDKPKVYSTLEYHVLPISKDKEFLNEICSFALAPIERTASDQKESSASAANGKSNILSGFSMDDQ